LNPNEAQVLAVIAARGGSERLPNKNLRELGGKPLIVWAIERALNAKYVDRVVLTTDSEEIAEVGKAAGAEVPFIRPADLSTNLIDTTLVVRHCVEWLVKHEGYRPDLVVHQFPTTPFATSSLTDECIELLVSNPDADSVVTVVQVPSNQLNPYKMFTLQEHSHRIEPLSIDPPFERAFDLAKPHLPIVHYHNPSCRVARFSTLMERASFVGETSLGYEMDPSDNVDIDTLEDLQAAERLMRARMEELERG
jgi:CMP-N,N'-diacetyllegionaminic acid synthase